VLPGRKSGFGPDFGRLLFWKASKQALQWTFGRPKGLFSGFPAHKPAEIRPGSPIYGPAAQLRNI
jgi:hypothetical protein